MSRTIQALLKRAKEVDATPFQINAAAILLAANGLPAALCYLDGCRTRFETATQVRAFLRGHGWKTEARTVKVKRSERGWIVRLPLPDSAEAFMALQRILAGTNAKARP
jgi:hypothetical protein